MCEWLTSFAEDTEKIKSVCVRGYRENKKNVCA